MDSIQQPLQQPSAPDSSRTIRISIIYFGVILIVSAIGFGIYSAFFSNDVSRDGGTSQLGGVTRVVIPSGPTDENAISDDQLRQAQEAEAVLQQAWEDRGDADIDGLSDEQELELGTDPNNRDTDGDGLSDRLEVEVLLSDPLLVDTDGDGIDDWNEDYESTTE